MGLVSKARRILGSSDFKERGGKEETYFDSRACLDSDCEDDFFSVKGDFTPSRGTTPVHINALKGPAFNNMFPDDGFPDTGSEVSPTTDRKKKLAELLQERIGSEKNDTNGMEQPNGKLDSNEAPKSSEGTPHHRSGSSSVCSTDATPNGSSKPNKKERALKNMQCCLPSLTQSLSFNSRGRRRSMSQKIVEV